MRLVTTPGNVRTRSTRLPTTPTVSAGAVAAPGGAGHGPLTGPPNTHGATSTRRKKSAQPYPGSPMTMSVPKEPSTQMQTTAEKTVLITGANAGIGKEMARQLASRPEIARIYLACRNQDRAATAKAELEAETGRRIFDIVLMDVADPGSVRAGLAGIDGSLDALVMNAGGMGGKTPMALTADGVTYMFAQNVLGHVVLLEALLAEDRLGEVAVFAGSEAARGIPKMGFKRPSFDSNSADELATVIDGSYFAGGKAGRQFGLWAGQADRHPMDGLPGPPIPRPPIHLREPRQHHRHPSTQ